MRLVRVYESAETDLQHFYSHRIISTYDADSHSHHFHQLLRSFASKQTQRTPRASISSTSALSDGTEHHGWNPVDVEWTIFQDWPQGLELEEREMKQYYKYLKFIHLELETKIRFITEIVDDLTADPPREAVVYTSRDVKERGKQHECGGMLHNAH